MSSAAPSNSALLEALGLDLESSLGEEPRFLMDPRFLGALHAELVEELGPRDTAAALAQMGFVHGLRDATLVLREGLAAGPVRATGGCLTAPRIAIQMAPPRPPRLEVRGHWPDRQEAEAVLASVGPRETPGCAASMGYTSGWLSGIFGADLLAVEAECIACGGETCRFVAREVAEWREQDPAEAGPLVAAALDALPFEALREIVTRSLSRLPEAPPPEGLERGFEGDSPVIHVWGPVMVIPFAGVEESLQALELIGRDPGARSVRVVIVDLSGTVIDDGFGALALEQILDAIEGWGAEPILTGVSPLAQRVVGDLEQSHLVIHKELPEAIAAAFQIAAATRVAV